MIIREAKSDDAEVLSVISGECGSDKWSESSFASEIEKDSIVLCCEIDEKIVGFVVVSVSFDEGYLHLIAVDSDCRNKGIGVSLLNAAEQIAENRQVTKIILDVRVSNEKAIKLYEKFNYSKICERRNFYSHPTENAFTMVKEL